MKVYLLKESDFERLDLIVRTIEAEAKADPGLEQKDRDLLRRYRYDLYSWINEVKGDR